MRGRIPVVPSADLLWRALAAAFAAALLFTPAHWARAQGLHGAGAPGLLVLPITVEVPGAASDDGERLARSLGLELRQRLAWRAWAFSLRDPLLRRALAEGRLNEQDLADLTDPSVSRRLGLALGADSVLTGRAFRRKDRLELELTLRAVASGQELVVQVEKAAPAGGARKSWQRALARQAVLALAGQGPQLQQLPLGAAVNAGAQHLARGQAALASGKLEQARTELELAVAAQPASPQSWAALAEARAAAGDRAAAVQAYRHVVALNPFDRQANLRLAQLAGGERVGAEALRSLRQLVQTSPQDTEARLALAEALAGAGQSRQAREEYARVLGLAPDNAPAHRGLAQLAEQAGEIGEARQHYAWLVQHDPSNRADRERLAWLRLRAGEEAAAIAELRALYEAQTEPARYPPEDYRELTRHLDAECEQVASELDPAVLAYRGGEMSPADFAAEVHLLHSRSANLARLAELVAPPLAYRASHNLRVLAYYLLNQSDFEALCYAESADRFYLDQARLYRESAQDALRQALPGPAVVSGEGQP